MQLHLHLFCGWPLSELWRPWKSLRTLGVHDVYRGCRPRMARDPMLKGWKPSTSFSRLIASRMRCSLMCLGSGSCTRIPCTASFSLYSCTTYITEKDVSERPSAHELVCCPLAGCLLQRRADPKSYWRGSASRCPFLTTAVSRSQQDVHGKSKSRIELLQVCRAVNSHYSHRTASDIKVHEMTAISVWQGG